MQKLTYSPTQYCVWEGSVKIPSKLGRRRSIDIRIHFNIENWIESMRSRWSSSGKFPRIHYIANLRQDSQHDDCTKMWVWAVPKTNHLHVHVQRHYTVRKRKQIIVHCEFPQCIKICKKICVRSLNASWIQKRSVVDILHFNRTENRTMLLRSWWSTLVKTDIPCFANPVLEKEEIWRGKEKESRL